jgi:nitrate/nitrite-specific signal transduction histidine kinase
MFMKDLFLILTFLVMGVACTSQQTKQDVQKQTDAVYPAVSSRIQYSRALAMVESNPDLSDEQKDELEHLIHKYTITSIEERMRLSQYRAVIVNEMLNTGSRPNPRVTAVKGDIKKLNRENSDRLERFVDEFRKIVGTTAKNHEPMMVEIIQIE